MEKKQILSKLKKLKPTYKKDGVEIVGLFGSFAEGNEHNFSDIDILYELDRDEFDKKYIGGFAKLIRLEEIKNELRSAFGKEVDLVPTANKALLQKAIYV